VARNSQRSRRRRSRQPGAGGPAAGSSRTEPRDQGLEPTEVDLGGTTPAPEPTKHAFPDVEEAELAEAGPIEGAVPDTEPNALDQVGPPPERHARVEHEHDQRGATGGNRLFTFLTHVVDELRRVQWPDRRQVGQSTLVVLLFVILAGGYLGLLDAIWQPLIKAIL
jgi:preprotein translocase SecE subunit